MRILAIILLLSGCSQFEAKMEQMNRLTCSPSDHFMCDGWDEAS